MSRNSKYRSCFVPQCSSNTENTPNKIFITVPQDIKIREKWIFATAALCWPIKNAPYSCCEDHFDLPKDLENYQYCMLMGGMPRLKKGVVPHKFECQAQSRGGTTKPAPCATLAERRREIKVDEILSASGKSDCPVAKAKKILRLMTKDVGTTTMEDGNFSLRSCIKTDQDLIFLTGIETFEIFHRIVDIVISINPLMTRSILEEIILMTYVKFKQNLSYKSLAILCRKPSAQKCEETVTKMLEVLSGCLECAIYWPTNKDIREDKLKTFRGLYEGVRVVVDCAEIKIEKPKHPSWIIPTYSPPKNDNTIKLVIGFSPFANICYISELYGGRMSHKAVFEHCDLNERLQRKDTIVADGRFVFDVFCRDKDLKFVTILNKRLCGNFFGETKFRKFSRLKLSDSCGTEDIEHIEKLNQRIRSFKILNDRLPTKLVKQIRNIVTVICGTVNLSSSIVMQRALDTFSLC